MQKQSCLLSQKVIPKKKSKNESSAILLLEMFPGPLHRQPWWRKWPSLELASVAWPPSGAAWKRGWSPPALRRAKTSGACGNSRWVGRHCNRLGSEMGSVRAHCLNTAFQTSCRGSYTHSMKHNIRSRLESKSLTYFKSKWGSGLVSLCVQSSTPINH